MQPLVFRPVLALVSLFWVSLLAPGVGAAGAAFDPASCPPCEVVWAQPRLTRDGQVASVSEGAGERILLNPTAPGDDVVTDQFRAGLERSAAWTLVRQLFTFAHRRVGAAGQPRVVVCVTDLFGTLGPVHAPYPVRVEGDVPVDAPAFIVIANFPDGALGGLTLDTLVKDGLLPLVLAHETAHLVMYETYTPGRFPRLASRYRGGHDVDRITDPFLAFTEGWAEAFEAIVGDLLLASGDHPVPTDPAGLKLMNARHRFVKRDMYIFDSVGKKAGRVRTGMQLVSTEGVVAYLVYQTYANRRLSTEGQPEAYGQVLDLLKATQPQDVVAFYKASQAARPVEASTLRRIFLEWTKYATAHPEGPARYLEWWTSQAAQRLPAADPSRPERLQEAAMVSSRFKAWREGLFANPALAVDGALAPGLDPLWVDEGMQRVGLNLVTPDTLAALLGRVAGASEDHLTTATQLCASRDSRGAWASMDQVTSTVGVSPAAKQALMAARRTFQENLAATPARGSVNAYRAGFTSCSFDTLLAPSEPSPR